MKSFPLVYLLVVGFGAIDINSVLGAKQICRCLSLKENEGLGKINEATKSCMPKFYCYTMWVFEWFCEVKDEWRAQFDKCCRAFHISRFYGSECGEISDAPYWGIVSQFIEGSMTRTAKPDIPVEAK